MRVTANNLGLWFAELRGGRRLLVVFFAGLMSGLAMPPVDAWWIWALTLPPLITTLQAVEFVSIRKRFGLGWIFGCGYFLAALHWIGFAFLVDAKADLWMMPFAVGSLAAGMAVFWGFAVALAQGLVRRGYPAFIVFPLSFGFFEWLRGNVLTGFPWAVPGLAADGMGGVLQLASIIGMNGLTVLILLWALVPLALLQTEKKSQLFAAALGVCLPLSWAWGAWRVASLSPAYLDGPVVRLVQPNISQSDKWRADNARNIFDQLLQLSRAPAKGLEPTVIVWPESAVPFLIDESAAGKAELASVLQDKKILLTGAVRRSSSDAASADYFTSILAFNSQAEVIAIYDKHHLVPGGEFLPLAWLLEPLGFRKVVNLPESFTSGTGPAEVDVPGLGLVTMQICYEDIFPLAIPSWSKRSDFILNVTNDGWFGNSAGPRQHLAQLRMRAVEQGLGVVRVANTGRSAILDATGGYVLLSEIERVAVLDSRIPKPFAGTVFSDWGEAGLLVLLSVFLGFAIVLQKRFVS